MNFLFRGKVAGLGDRLARRPACRGRCTLDEPQAPRRPLIVSADIGEGHNSAGRALAEAMTRAWPGCQVGWLDAPAAMGPPFAAAARAFYVSQVQHLPWMYEFFFSAMWRHRWYLDLSGGLDGRRVQQQYRSHLLAQPQ